MAEKVILTSVDIDVVAAVKDTQKLREEVIRLRKVTEDLKDTQGETSKEYIIASAQLKTATSELRTHENMLGKVVAANKANIGSIEQMRSELSVVSAAWAKLSKEERLNSEAGKALAGRKLELTNALKAEEKATGDARRNVGNYTDTISQMPGPMGNAANSVKGLSNAFKALLANPIVLLIAAIVGALVGLFKAFKSTDSGATELAARMEQLKAILDVIRQRAVALIGAFKSLFSGDFKKAGEEFKATFTGIGEQMRVATKAAYDYIKALDAIEDSENNFISRSAEIRNAIAKLEFTSQDRSKSTEERKKALQEAMALGLEEVAELKRIAEEKLKLKAQELAATQGLQGDAVIAFMRMSDEEQANADASLQTLRNNNEAKFKDIEQLYANWLDADTRFFDENKRNFSRMTGFEEEMRKEAAAARVERLHQESRAAVDDFLAMVEEKHGKEIQLESAKDDVVKGLEDRAIERAKLNYENDLALLEGTLFGELELERLALDAKEKQETDAANRIGANTTLIEKKFAKARKSIAMTERDAKMALAGDFMKNVAQIAGEQSAIGKAAAVAGTTIDTFRGAQAAFTGMTSTIPGPVGIALGVAAAAAAVASGIANVKKILAVKTGLPGEGSVSGSGSGGSAATPPPPALTTVNPEIGAGIVSRDTSGVAGGTQTSMQPTLVVDAVTAAQTTQTAQQTTAVL